MTRIAEGRNVERIGAATSSTARGSGLHRYRTFSPLNVDLDRSIVYRHVPMIRHGRFFRWRKFISVQVSSRSVPPNVPSLCALPVVLFLLAISFTAASCSSSPNNPHPKPHAGPSVDQSLSVSEYVDAGLPTPTDRWGVEEYAAAVRVLERLSQETAARLPRHLSEQSGSMFARLVATENLAHLRDTNRSVDERWDELSAFVPAVAPLQKIYASGDRYAREFVYEQIELRVLELETIAITSTIVQELASQFASTDFSSPSRHTAALRRSLEKAQETIEEDVMALLDQIEGDAYGVHGSRRLAEELTGHIRETLGGLSSRGTTKLIARIRSLKAAEVDAPLRDQWARMLQLTRTRTLPPY